MHFEYPAFLFALSALIIPVIIHLFNFRRYKKVYFSNVQFLQQVQEQQAARHNLKERLILLSRLLAVLFLVLAFSKPFFSDKGKSGVAANQVVSIFVDNSNSMQALGSEGSLLDEAKSKAKDIAAAYGPNTRFQLITQDFFGKDQRFIDRTEFYNRVDGIQLSSQTRNLQSILNRQRGLLSVATTGDKLYILSDFQYNMDAKHLAVDFKNTSLNFVQLKANKLPNVAVDSVWLPGAVHRPGELQKLVLKLHNYADEKAVNIPIKLLINGMQKALGSYSVNSKSVITDTLSFSGLQPGWQTAELNLQDNPVTFDNVFHFSFFVSANLSVLIISNGQENSYLKAVFDAEPFFKVTTAPFGSINYSTLSTFPLIVMADVKSISTGLGEQLKTYIQKGGNLSIFPSVDMDISSYNTFLQALNAGRYNKNITDRTKVSAINLNAGVYKNTFERMPQNPDLPKVFAYFPINNSVAGENLMTLQNGSPFWQQFNYRHGKIYLCAVPLDEGFSSLPRHAMFVTTMLRIGLLSGQSQQLYTTISNNQPIVLNNISTGPDDILKLTNGNEQIIPDVRNLDGVTTLFVSDQITKPGTYKLLKKDSLIQLLSFNNDRKESDMHYYTPAELEKLTDNNARIVTSTSSQLKNTISGQGLGFQLWKLCLLLSLIFLGAEILLVRFYKVPKVVAS